MADTPKDLMSTVEVENLKKLSTVGNTGYNGVYYDAKNNTWMEKNLFTDNTPVEGAKGLSFAQYKTTNPDGTLEGYKALGGKEGAPSTLLGFDAASVDASASVVNTIGNTVELLDTLKTNKLSRRNMDANYATLQTENAKTKAFYDAYVKS